MGHCFSHLSKTDRYKIEALLNTGHSKQEIADELHVHISTIYREVKRARMTQLTTDYQTVNRYNPDLAEKRYRDNLSAKGPPLKIATDYDFAEYIEKKIVDEKRSPAAALHEIELEGKQFETSVCVTTLYSYIDKGVFLNVSNEDLPEKPKRKKKNHKGKTMKRPPRGESIEKRPPEVAERKTFGHWEMDTVYGKKESSKDALLVLTERLTRKEIIVKMPDRTAESTIKALDSIENEYGERFPIIFRTITVDNGGEFADVERLERSAADETKKRTKIFFCHPYSSYERGSNENQNRMIRREFPKGTDFGPVPEKDIKTQEEWINNYPRKVLDWKTSEILFQEQISLLFPVE